jgi:CubicO group peptidase (beta-lactamase class C family)
MFKNNITMKKIYLLTLLLTFTLIVGAQPLQRVSPASVGMDASKLAYADAAILKSIQDKDIPGAVLAVVRHGKMAWLKAYGNKQIYPTTEAMTTNTVFDMASCSKSMSTAVCAMILIERGLLRLTDRVNFYIPGFENWKGADGQTQNIRIVDLMTHTSGLPPYAPVDSLKKKYGAPNPDGVINYISHCKRDFKPETDFQYSCLNYITLQRIIETISGQSLRDFAKKNIFDVLGMKHTDYCPTGALRELCAPTEKQADGSVLKGVVHDPLARIMNGGISGNAGVFSSADDIALLAAALQNGGEWNGHRILSPLGVKAMRTVPRCVATLGRTLGWDIFTAYASNNGDLFGPNTYGHTGYTGTSIVIDPDNDTSVILLTNRVHPNDGGEVIRLRSLVSNAVAASIIPNMAQINKK